MNEQLLFSEAAAQFTHDGWVVALKRHPDMTTDEIARFARAYARARLGMGTTCPLNSDMTPVVRDNKVVVLH